jgi:hypothetical protein
MRKLNATIVTSPDSGLMWLVPTADAEEASEIAMDYAPQSFRAVSGTYSYQPIFHPNVGAIMEDSL